MTILVYIGNNIIQKERIRGQSGRDLLRAFNNNFYLLYNNESVLGNIHNILHNNFIDKGTKTLLMNLYMKIQRTKFGMIKFQTIWKRTKAKSSSVETDLYMNSLKNFPENQKITLLQRNTLYNFRLSDILTIWNNALSYSITFSPYPKNPKNPFTNLDFNKGHLTNIYFKLKKTNFFIPILINIFWKCSFNLDEFREEAFPILKEKAISNYMEETNNDTLFYDIINMIESLSKFLNNRTISEDLPTGPRIKFVSDMKPFLKMFLLSEHTSNVLKKRKWTRKVIIKLEEYFKIYPMAGRRIVVPATYSNSSFVFPSPLNIEYNNGIFVFGANNNQTNPPEAGAEADTELDTDAATSSEVDQDNYIGDESYNEVLDDSDNELEQEQIQEEILLQNTNDESDESDTESN